MTQGTLYIISAPSGAGKSSLIQAVLKSKLLYDIHISISYTTREVRPGERNGEHYYFISKQKFEKMIKQNFFLEYAEVFGNYYGTPRTEIEGMLKAGIDIFLDIDWQGGQKVRREIPSARSIFVLPPSKNELDRRLRKRSQDNEKTIARRMAQAATEMSHFAEYDYLIINDNFHVAFANLKAIIYAERLRIDRQKYQYAILIDKLLKD